MQIVKWLVAVTAANDAADCWSCCCAAGTAAVQLQLHLLLCSCSLSVMMLQTRMQYFMHACRSCTAAALLPS
jgi:hypothetical protein